jgi:ATP-dependent helicase/nuclease subunit A
MSVNYQIKGPDAQRIQKDQKDVMDAYLAPGGRVSVGAGAGTGKTFTLIMTLAEQVLRLLNGKPKNFNPLKRVLVVSFGKEASRQLKAKLRKALREHEAVAGQLPVDLWRYIESESNIQTIDSFLQSLLREISVEAGVNPAFEVPNGLDQDQLVDSIIDSIRRTKSFDDAWQRLERVFPALDFAEFPPENLRQMLWNTHQKMREFCMDAQTVKTELLRLLDEAVHQNVLPPFTIAQVRGLANTLSAGTLAMTLPQAAESDMVKHAEDTYATSKKLAVDFGDLLIAFDKEYDPISRSEGTLTYNDVAYLVWKYTYTSGDTSWTTSLSNRFDHILVDEFQDTNYVQHQMLLSLVRAGAPNARSSVMFIGDVKQSIYKWRSAEPRIFIDLMDAIHSGKSLGQLQGMVYRPLTSNFRSNDSLISFYNGVFEELFKDGARGAVAGPILYEALDHKRTDVEDKKIPKTHVFMNDGKDRNAWVNQETTDFTSAIQAITRDDSPIKIYDGERARPPLRGEVALLFRSSTNIPAYVNSLRRAGISCAVQTDISLFGEPEISLVIDFLNWLANPDSRESVTRILRSPVVSLSDKTLRYLASKSFRLASAYRAWSTSLGLPSEDRDRIMDLLDFKDDLRWDREGPKAALISKIIAHGRLDSVLLSSEEGIQAQANLWVLGEVVSKWEEEELMSYQEFVERLKTLRERAYDGREDDYSRAILADESTTSSVKIMTVHASKGLEFPVVFLPETIVTTNEFMQANERVARTREGGIILRPRGSTVLPGGVRIIGQNSPRPIPWVSRGNENSVLWLNPIRDRTTGTFLAASPVNQRVRDQVAEFWRLLYVGCTRAKDHLVFSVSNHNNWNKAKWTSWMAFLKEALQLGNVASTVVNHTATIQKGSWVINVGVNDLPRAPLRQPAPFTNPPKPTSSPQPYNSGGGSFIPAVLDPSTFQVLVECPRRYQYQVLWRTTGVREVLLPVGFSGASPPSKMNAGEWGTRVHEALQIRDFSRDQGLDTPFGDLLKKEPTIASDLVTAVNNFERLAVGKSALAAAKRGNQLMREVGLQGVVTSGPGDLQILVKGKVDLLFQDTGGNWVLVDYKAEEKPPSGSYRERLYNGQIQAYVWLIEKTLGMKVNTAYLAYIHPYSDQVAVTPSPTFFETQVNTVIPAIQVDPQRGLQARPSYAVNGPCGSCPYNKRDAGGPCEN